MCVDTLSDTSMGVNMCCMKLVAEITEACCPQVLRNPLDAQEAEEMAQALRVIADPTRLRVLSILASAKDQEGCVCDLTEPLGVGQPTVSHHLKVLSDAGLVTREQRGRWAFYRLSADRLAFIRRALTP
jgi:ArsR family transcriptional regulator